MSDALVVLWGICYLVAFVGCVPYGIWMIATAYRRRWKVLGLQAGIPVLGYCLLWGVSWFVYDLGYKQYLRGLFDADVALEEVLYSCHSERAFNGDGYSFSVFELPQTLRVRFEAVDDRLLTEFPKRPDHRKDWEFERWRPTPFDQEFESLLDFGLGVAATDNAPGIEAHFEAAWNALSGENAYYAFFYYGYSGNIDLFIVDLDGGRLYLINHNT